MPTDTIPARLLEQARRQPEVSAYHVRQADGTWTGTSWGTYAEECKTAGRALMALGVSPGDRVCLLGFNRPEWVIFDIGAMMAGACPAGIYTTCSPTEVQYIIDHADAEVVLLEDEGQWEKVKAQRENLPKLRHIVMMRGAKVSDPQVLSWEAFLAKAAGTPESELTGRLDGVAPDDLATFIYTSGTTGPPKAVMLTHDNLAWTASAATDLIALSSDDKMVSYLPLSHIAEQVFSIHGPLTAGYGIYFAESIERLPDNLREVQPTIVFAVPRVWEKMHAKITAALALSTGVKAFLVNWALGVGRQVSRLKNKGDKPTGFLAFQYRLADRVIFSKLKPKLGLGSARFGITGAAPISGEILEFFASLDVIIHEVYGQSEGTGPTSFNTPGSTRFGTVGPAIPGEEVRIAEDGEIVVKGRNIFKGYFKDPAATAEALVDGWLQSGDLGAFDDDGFLRITGRKKEIIITAGGKNIAPKNIEAALKNLPLVSQAVVIGDRRKFLSALITLDPDAAATFAEANGLALEAIHTAPALVAALDKGVEAQVNSLFARVEHVRKFTVLPRDFSVDEGELTPTLKIKRRIIYANFADEIEAMYS